MKLGTNSASHKVLDLHYVTSAPAGTVGFLLLLLSYLLLYDLFPYLVQGSTRSDWHFCRNPAKGEGPCNMRSLRCNDFYLVVQFYESMVALVYWRLYEAYLLLF